MVASWESRSGCQVLARVVLHRAWALVGVSRVSGGLVGGLGSGKVVGSGFKGWIRGNAVSRFLLFSGA